MPGRTAPADSTYVNAHRAVARAFGKAAQYRCDEECGRQAYDWAHTHEAELSDLNAYRPLCRPCHNRYDIHLTHRGEQLPQAKLTEDDVREIRSRYAAGGESWRTLGLEFGVHRQSIGEVLLYQTWAHVA
jgi:hypothetical protein